MPRYRKRHKRGTWKGTRCWFVVLHLVAFIISSLSYTNAKSIFSKPKLLNCWVCIQNPILLTIWRLYKCVALGNICFPLFKFHTFFLVILIEYLLGITRYKWRKKKGARSFLKMECFFLWVFQIFWNVQPFCGWMKKFTT